MEIVELLAQAREETGTKEARRLRAAGKVPVSLYGQKTDAAKLVVESREFERIMRGHAGSSFIMKLKVEGRDDTSVIIKEIQRHPLRDHLLHIDLLSVALDEKIVTGIPVRLVGESIGVREGGVMQAGVRELQIEALPTELPEFIEVDVVELNIGQSIHASELKLPESTTLVGNADEVVATVLEPTKLVEPTVEEVLGEGAEGEAAEGEAAEGEAAGGEE